MKSCLSHTSKIKKQCRKYRKTILADGWMVLFVLVEKTGMPVFRLLLDTVLLLPYTGTVIEKELQTADKKR